MKATKDGLIESHDGSYENLWYTNVFEPLEHGLLHDRVKRFQYVYKAVHYFWRVDL